MAKVMLVEDDNNLREIYEARLAAEGYDIVAAQDGEEALALAVKERPDLIIADIMMPKVSGFDMLDILRSTPETKHTKIIMMTALSQAEDKTRAEKLGADRYLVKSQVTLEDVVKVASEMLNDQGGGATPPPVSAPTPPTPSEPPTTDPASSIPTIAPTEPPAASDNNPAADDSSTATAAPSVADEPATTVPVTAAPPAEEPTAPQPVKEEAPTPSPEPPTTDKAATLSSSTVDEEAQVTQQIDEFIKSNPTLSESAEPKKTESSSTTEPETPATASPPSEPTFKEEIITTESPASTPPPAKSTSIPVTVADDAPSEEKPSKPGVTPQGTSNPADQTMAKAVDNLIGKDKGAETEQTHPNEPTSAPEVSDKPQLAKKRGGERVIEPLSDPTIKDPDIDALLAKEGDAGGISPPPANAVIAPGGAVTTAVNPDPAASSQPTFSDGNAAPGAVVQAPTTDPATPSDNSANISL